MTSSPRPSSERWRTGVSFGEVLEGFQTSSEEIVCWRRPIPDAVVEDAGRWASCSDERAVLDGTVESAHLPDVRFIEALEYRLTEFVSPHTASWLAGDIIAVGRTMHEHFGGDRFRLRIGPVQTDSCRKFHADHVRVRAITTYVGPGTEWVKGADVEEMHQEDSPTLHPHGRFSFPTSAVRRAQPGDILVIKGALADTRGGIHRSPPIEGTGQQRLMMSLTTTEPDDLP